MQVLTVSTRYIVRAVQHTLGEVTASAEIQRTFDSCGTTVLVVSSGAWFVSHMLADTTANFMFLHHELSYQSGNMRCFISGKHYPKEAASPKPASDK